jgi:hypothetical protein
MTDRNRYQGRAIPPHVVKMTWENLLKDENSLPHGWEKGLITGVLVGKYGADQLTQRAGTDARRNSL